MNFKAISFGIAVGAALLAAAPAAAQFQKPEDAVKYRKAAFTVMASHFGRVGAMANGRVPFDAKAVEANLAVVDELHKLPFATFTADTEKVEGSKAKPDVWKETAKFKEAQDKFQAEVPKLLAAGKTGNLDQVKAAFAAVGGSCKACHDAFQAK